jgi:transposase
MLEALVAGERGPVVLADKALRKMRPKIPALTEALAGRFASHHAVVVRAILAHIDFIDANIAALDDEVAARLGPFQPAVELLKTIPGVSQTAAEVFVAETGGDMSRLPPRSTWRPGPGSPQRTPDQPASTAVPSRAKGRAGCGGPS